MRDRLHSVSLSTSIPDGGPGCHGRTPMVRNATHGSPSGAEAAPAWSLEGTDQGPRLSVRGGWRLGHGGDVAFPTDALASVQCRKGQTLLVDVAGLTYWDSSLISFLWNAKQAAGRASLRFGGQDLPSSAQRLLALLPETPEQPATHHTVREPALARVGHAVLTGLTETGTLSSMMADIATGAMQALRGRSAMRARDLFQDIWNAGPSALLIVSIVNFLVGAILAFVGLIELRKFAAEIYITNLVGIACAREISAIMTAIIMAGRTGGAYAARISTMQGNEEIDALHVTGIPVSGYILLPSVLSLTVMMPVLYLYGTLVAMCGGFVVAMSMMDISPVGYWLSTLNGVELKQFVFGFIKSVFFAAFIALAACRVGLRAGRSAADVGIAATRAVVIGIVGIIALDAVFAVIANALGF